MTTTDKSMSKLLDQLWIDLAGNPWTDLFKGRTLRVLHHRVAFLLAGPGVGQQEAIAEAKEMQGSCNVPVLLVTLTKEDLTEIDWACGWENDKPWAHVVPAYDWYANMSPVGSIRLNAVGGTESPCEHGYLARFTNVARVLHKNDLFMVVDRNDDGLVLVYRALADYDRRTNRVLFERTTPGLEQPVKQYMELAPNLLVHVSLDQIEDAQPLSADDVEMARNDI